MFVEVCVGGVEPPPAGVEFTSAVPFQLKYSPAADTEGFSTKGEDTFFKSPALLSQIKTSVLPAVLVSVVVEGVGIVVPVEPVAGVAKVNTSFTSSHLKNSPAAIPVGGLGALVLIVVKRVPISVAFVVM